MRGLAIWIAFAVIAVAVTFALVTVSIIYGMVETEIIEKTAAEKTLVEGAAYLVESCFREGQDAISTEFLDSNKDSTVCQIKECQICARTIGVKLKDLETDKEWDFGYSESRYMRVLSVSLKDKEGNVHAGRLFVSLA